MLYLLINNVYNTHSWPVESKESFHLCFEKATLLIDKSDTGQSCAQPAGVVK